MYPAGATKERLVLQLKKVKDECLLECAEQRDLTEKKAEVMEYKCDLLLSVMLITEVLTS